VILIGYAFEQIIWGAIILAIVGYSLDAMIGDSSPEGDNEGDDLDDDGARADAGYDRDRDERARL
jgi:hypothetical protein